MLLEESGISPMVVAERGYYTAKTKAELARLGFSKSQQRAPALVVPMYSLGGELVTHQIRLDHPRENNKGKPAKYETPSGSALHLDVHPSQTERVRDASVPLWITEGVKKADSLVSRGQCVVALQGVWCWQKEGVPLAEWEDIKLHGRLVIVAFDSDVTVNPKVQKALEALVRFLRGRGAKVKVLYLPSKDDGSKQGVDDFLASGETTQGLARYIEDGLREGLGEVGRSLADVVPQEVEWLWPRRIPKGKITVLDGDPDNGKTVLMMDLAAQLTTGSPMPDGTSVEAAGAVILSAEDGEDDTIRPRFDAAGGDPRRVLLLSTIPESNGEERLFVIPEDLSILERGIRQVGPRWSS
jgi:hypothetical protein